MTTSVERDAIVKPAIFWRFEFNTTYTQVPVETISSHRSTTKVRLLKASQSHKEGTILCIPTAQIVQEAVDPDNSMQ